MKQTLPEAALPAWNAYRAMEESKQKYFSYLEALENEYEQGGYRTSAESARLEALLKEHDEQVAEFRRSMMALRNKDASAHQSLIDHITLLNAEIGIKHDRKGN